MPNDLTPLESLWKQKYPRKATGGVFAIQGFRFQFICAIREALRIIGEKALHGGIGYGVLTERLSDVISIGTERRVVQVKRSLTSATVQDALHGLWEIHHLALTYFPSLLEGQRGLRYGIRGAVGGDRDWTSALAAWVPTSHAADPAALALFKERIDISGDSLPLNDIVERLANEYHDPTPMERVWNWIGRLVEGSEGEFGNLLPEIERDLIRLRNDRERACLPADLNLLTDKDQPPDGVIPHAGVGAGVLTGERPDFLHIRKGYFAPLPTYTDLADVAARWIDEQSECYREEARELKVFWIGGQSGAGKSVALLHVLASLHKQGYGPIIWVGNSQSRLEAAVVLALDLSRNGERHPIIAIDDPYAPNSSENPLPLWERALDRLRGLAEGQRPPLLLACGPDEQSEYFEQDLTADRVIVTRHGLVRAGNETLDGLRDWFQQRTGGAPPTYEDDQNLLLVQLFHQWEHKEPLRAFAERFRSRIRAMDINASAADAPSMETLMAHILSFNRLYLGYPAGPLARLDDRRRGQLEQLKADFHLAINGPDFGRPGVWLKHPHLATAIYDCWFPPDRATQRPVRSGHLRDATLEALDHGDTPQERTAPLWTLVRGSSHDGIALTGRVPDTELRPLLRELYGRIPADRFDLSLLPVWIEAERRFPDIGLAPSPAIHRGHIVGVGCGKRYVRPGRVVERFWI